MSPRQKKLATRRQSDGQQGQSLVETAITLPLLLGLAFNFINWAYLWIMVLTLSAAPRMGVEYATQGGAAGTATAPGATTVSSLVYDNLTNAIGGATTSNVAVQVCSSSIGVNSSNGVALCSQFGPAYTFPTPAADPEQPVYVLDRVDVEYTVTPIIPGAAFNAILPSNLKFHRQVSMRSLY
jgi:Flp pilus assembly protein TadG